MDNLDIIYEYVKLQNLCKVNYISSEKHDLSEVYIWWDTHRIRLDIYTDKNYRTIRKLFPNYQIDKLSKKTIWWQNQYLISYDYIK